MKKQATTKNHLMFSGTIALVALAGFFYAFWFLQGQLSVLVALNKEAEKFAVTEASLSSIQKVMDDAEGEAARIDSYLIDQDGVVAFIEEVEGLARDNNLDVTVEGIEAKEIDKETKNLLEKVIMRIETRGTWQNTYQFLLLVESLPYKISLDGVSLAKLIQVGGGSGSAQWKGDFAVSAIKLK